MVLGASVRRATSLASFSIGLQFGAILVGLATWLVATLIWTVIPSSSLVRLIVALVLLAALLLRELGILDYWLPENRRLVPEVVFFLGPVYGPLQFGIEMGTGMRTLVPSTMPYILLTGALVAGEFWVCVLAAVGFALGRATMMYASVFFGDVGAWNKAFQASRVAARLALVVLAAYYVGYFVFA